MKYLITFLIVLGVGFKVLTGEASYYHNRFEGKKTASGQPYSKHKLTAASNKFNLGDSIRVTNTKNNKKVTVVVNDRMSNNGRLIDLSRAAADSLGFVKDGVTVVKVSKI